MAIRLTKTYSSWFGTLELPKPMPEPGEQVFYYGGFGADPPVKAIVESYTKKDGEFIVCVNITNSNGRSSGKWGYLDQISW